MGKTSIWSLAPHTHFCTCVCVCVWLYQYLYFSYIFFYIHVFLVIDKDYYIQNGFFNQKTPHFGAKCNRAIWKKLFLWLMYMGQLIMLWWLFGILKFCWEINLCFYHVSMSKRVNWISLVQLRYREMYKCILTKVGSVELFQTNRLEEAFLKIVFTDWCVLQIRLICDSKE